MVLSISLSPFSLCPSLSHLSLSLSLSPSLSLPISLFLSPRFKSQNTSPLSLSPSFLPLLSLTIGRFQPLSLEDTCPSLYSSQSDSQYGSLPRGWSEELDKYGHTLYVSDYTNEKVPGLSLTSCLSDYLSVLLSVDLSVCLSVCLSGSPEIGRAHV